MDGKDIDVPAADAQDGAPDNGYMDETGEESDGAADVAPDSADPLSKFIKSIKKINFLNKIKDVPAVKKQQFTIILLVALIIVTAGVFFYFFNLSGASSVPENAVYIKMPASRLNNSNYIFPSVLVDIDGAPVVIQKMAISPLATVFYLNAAVDFHGAPLSVKDDAGNVYEPDYACIGTDTDTLFFQPFIAPVRYFTLEMADANVLFYIEGGYIASPSAFSIGAMDVTFSASAFKVGDGAFCSAVSRLNFMVKTNAAEGYIFENEYGDAMLKEGAGKYTPLGRYEYRFADGVIVGRYDFPPVMSLVSYLTFETGGLFRRYAPGTEFYITTHDRDIVFDIGAYAVTVEGFARQGDYYVLVLHGATAADGGRVETRLNARLTISAGADERIVVDSFCYSGPVGSDVLFDISAVKDRLAGKELTYTVEVAEAAFLADNIFAALIMTDMAPDHGGAFAAALDPYDETAQIAAYMIEGDTMYAAVLERVDGAVITHTDILVYTDGDWVRR